MTAIFPLRTGSFPHEAYVARCHCIDGKEEPTLNYANHKIGPPKCSSCKRPYQLEISLMSTAQKEKKK